MKVTIINRGEWLLKPGKHQSFMLEGRCAQNVILVSSLVTSNQRTITFLHGKGQKTEQKHTTKKFVGFHNHFALIIMRRQISD